MTGLEDGRLQARAALGLAAMLGLAWLAVPHPVVAVGVALVPIAAMVALRKAIWLGVGFILFSFFRLHEVVPQLMPLKLPLLLALGTIGALGWGQIQIANSNYIVVNSQYSRRQWMIEMCDTLMDFYPREIAKINARIERFHKLKQQWQERPD